MRGVLLGVMMLALIPTTSNARAVTSYYDTKGDWVVIGVREGYKLDCVMNSERPSNMNFRYIFSNKSVREPAA